VEVGGEADPASSVALEQLGEVSLVDKSVAGLEGGNLTLVIVDAYDIVADLGEANGRHQSYITGANNCNLYGFAHGLPAWMSLTRTIQAV
jgi:hypothetical protein